MINTELLDKCKQLYPTLDWQVLGDYYGDDIVVRYKAKVEKNCFINVIQYKTCYKIVLEEHYQEVINEVGTNFEHAHSLFTAELVRQNDLLWKVRNLVGKEKD